MGVLIGIGVLLLLVGGGALWYASSQRKKRGELAAAETFGCRDLASLHEATASETGPGQFAHVCEVVGAAQPANGEPDKAPLSGQPAVWHRSKVTHKYWETRRERDPDGSGYRTRRVERSRVMSDEKSTQPFAIDDGTGRVLVDPNDAELDRVEQTVNQFEQDTSGQSGGSVSAFGFTVQLGSGSGSLGFQREEWVIRPGARLYVLGEASDRSGQLRMGKPTGGGRFLISTRSEEEIAAASEKGARIGTIVGGVSLAVGAALVIAGLVVGLL